MLAYVFSHRPASGTDTAAYEALLRRFHAALATSPPSGFVRSATFRSGGAYSDWYLVESSAALDALNQAAISGRRSEPHDAVAQMAADGSGKLMTLTSGSSELAPGFEVRFSKPPGVGYPELDRMLEPWTGLPGVSVWKRMMVLGPPPEFSMLSPSAVELPAAMGPHVLSREAV